MVPTYTMSRGGHRIDEGGNPRATICFPEGSSYAGQLYKTFLQNGLPFFVCRYRRGVSLTSKGQLELVAVPARGIVEDRDAHFHHAPRGKMPLRRLHEKRRPKT